MFRLQVIAAPILFAFESEPMVSPCSRTRAVSEKIDISSASMHSARPRPALSRASGVRPTGGRPTFAHIRFAKMALVTGSCRRCARARRRLGPLLAYSPNRLELPCSQWYSLAPRERWTVVIWVPPARSPRSRRDEPLRRSPERIFKPRDGGRTVRRGLCRVGTWPYLWIARNEAQAHRALLGQRYPPRVRAKCLPRRREVRPLDATSTGLSQLQP